MDVVDSATRSKMMASIRGKNTKPEMMVRRYLHACGFRYRLHGKKLAGRPDLVLGKRQAVIFVHGCFWHRHTNCRLASEPRTHIDFWTEKFEKNMVRDQRNQNALLEEGWRVAIIWECSLRKNHAAHNLESLADWLLGDEREFETAVFD